MCQVVQPGFRVEIFSVSKRMQVSHPCVDYAGPGNAFAPVMWRVFLRAKSHDHGFGVQRSIRHQGQRRFADVVFNPGVRRNF